MPTDTSPHEQIPSRSEETARDHLRDFLRMIAKDIVRRLAETVPDSASRSKDAKASRQRT